MGDDAGREDGSVAGSHGRLGGRAGAAPGRERHRRDPWAQVWEGQEEPTCKGGMSRV